MLDTSKRSSRMIINKEAGRIDRVFLFVVTVLSAFGTLMIFSAGSAYAAFRYGDEYYFIKKQIIWLIISFAVLLCVSNVDIKIIKKITPSLQKTFIPLTFEYSDSITIPLYT